MCIVSFSVPNELMAARNIPADRASDYARLMFAAGVYMDGEISAEDAAALGGTDTATFQNVIHRMRHGGMARDEDVTWLLSELEKGARSKRWYTEAEMDAQFERRRAELLRRA